MSERDMERMVSRGECLAHNAEIQASLRELRAGVKDDLHQAIQPIVLHLERLNSRTAKTEVEVAVLKSKMAIIGGAVGTASGVVGALVIKWLG